MENATKFQQSTIRPSGGRSSRVLETLGWLLCLAALPVETQTADPWGGRREAPWMRVLSPFYQPAAPPPLVSLPKQARSTIQPPSSHTAPAEPPAAHTVINTAGQQLHPSTLTASTSSTHHQPTAAAFLIRSFAERQSDAIHYYFAPFLLERTSCFLIADNLNLFVFQKWIRSRR